MGDTLCVLTCLVQTREAHWQSENTLWAEGTVTGVGWRVHFEGGIKTWVQLIKRLEVVFPTSSGENPSLLLP